MSEMKQPKYYSNVSESELEYDGGSDGDFIGYSVGVGAAAFCTGACMFGAINYSSMTCRVIGAPVVDGIHMVLGQGGSIKAAKADFVNKGGDLNRLMGKQALYNTPGKMAACIGGTVVFAALTAGLIYMALKS